MRSKIDFFNPLIVVVGILAFLAMGYIGSFNYRFEDPLSWQVILTVIFACIVFTIGYAIVKYKVSIPEKREIDFIVESADGSILGIEVKCGSAVGKGDFAHLAWFRDNLAGQRKFIGIVLYTGSHTLPFGEQLYAVPMGTICT